MAAAASSCAEASDHKLSFNSWLTQHLFLASLNPTCCEPTELQTLSKIGLPMFLQKLALPVVWPECYQLRLLNICGSWKMVRPLAAICWADSNAPFRKWVLVGFQDILSAEVKENKMEMVFACAFKKNYKLWNSLENSNNKHNFKQWIQKKFQ